MSPRLNVGDGPLALPLALPLPTAVPQTVDYNPKQISINSKGFVDGIQNSTLLTESKQVGNYKIIIIRFNINFITYYVLVIVGPNKTLHSRGFRWSDLSKGNSAFSERVHHNFFSVAMDTTTKEYITKLKSALSNKQYSYEARKLLKGGKDLSLAALRGVIGMMITWLFAGPRFLMSDSMGIMASARATYKFWRKRRSDPLEQTKSRMVALIKNLEHIIIQLQKTQVLDVDAYFTTFFDVLATLSDTQKTGLKINIEDPQHIEQIEQIEQIEKTGGYKDIYKRKKRKKRKNTMRKNTRRQNTRRKNTKIKNTRRKNTKRKNTKRKNTRKKSYKRT